MGSVAPTIHSNTLCHWSMSFAPKYILTNNVTNLIQKSHIKISAKIAHSVTPKKTQYIVVADATHFSQNKLCKIMLKNSISTNALKTTPEKWTQWHQKNINIFCVTDVNHFCQNKLSQKMLNKLKISIENLQKNKKFGIHITAKNAGHSHIFGHDHAVTDATRSFMAVLAMKSTAA